ncbi:hypothetical protein ASE64_15260 [Agreia sp. Leaf210]|nr:hypothetical protein ASE64_15260 [Agreia sp. Leaf210]
MPKQLLFDDSHGTVLLVDCWARGFHTNLSSGSGRVWAKYAIPGIQENTDFLQINGARSLVSGLHEWLGKRSIETDVDRESRALTVTAKSGSPVLVNSTLSLQPTWGIDHASNNESITVTDLVYCVSRSADPVDWTDLTRTHLGLRDLLVLSRWIAESSTVEGALKLDDPLKTLDGTEHGEQWRSVTAIQDRPELMRPAGYRPHLIEFDDIGANGIDAWLKLREDFSRALDPVISDRFLDRVGPVTHMAQIGPGLEALGYLLLLRDNIPNAQAKNSPLRVRLIRILQDVAGSLPFDETEWIEGTVSAYNGIKHANRKLPSELELLNRWRESVLVIRAWVALELGLTPEVVKSRLSRDPQSSPYVARS